MIFHSMADARKLLDRDGPAVFEVLVSFDTRELDYQEATDELKTAWASSPRSAYICLGAGAETVLPPTWARVKLMRQVLAMKRVKYAAWLDTDAAPVLMFASLSTANKNRAGGDLNFMSLEALWREHDPEEAAWFLGYRIEHAHDKCPRNCRCGELFGHHSPKPHHDFNSGVFVVREGADAILKSWLQLHSPWPSDAKGTQWKSKLSEQFQFEAVLAEHGKVCLVRQRHFASSSAVVAATPFVHWFGMSAFSGKALLKRWMWNLRDKCNREQRCKLPRCCALAQKFVARSSSAEASKVRKQRQKSSKAVRKALGKKCSVKGRSFASVRSAASATGVSRRRAAIRQKRLACESPSGSDKGFRQASNGRKPLNTVFKRNMDS